MLNATLITLGAMAMLVAGCAQNSRGGENSSQTDIEKVLRVSNINYSHPGGRGFEDYYYEGGPNRAFLMHIVANRKLCADPNRVALVGEEMHSHSLPWHEGITIGELVGPMRWRTGSGHESMAGKTLIADFLRFAIIGIWRNQEGRFEKISRTAKTSDELAKVTLHRGDIVIRLEKRVCF